MWNCLGNLGEVGYWGREMMYLGEEGWGYSLFFVRKGVIGREKEKEIFFRVFCNLCLCR